MKSAYEIAMERMKLDDQSTALTTEQKQKLSEIEAVYRSKIAEKEIFLNKQIEDTLKQGDHQNVESLRRQLLDEKAILTEDMEAEKNTIRNQTSA